jgi:3-oxoacyl-[acyl-carrier-protein] synthase-3
MNGREVFRFAARVMDRASRDVMHKAGWTADQVDVFVPHQANLRIIESASRSLGIPMGKFVCNIEHYGNTSAASIPIALAEAAESGRLRPNHRVVMVGFGAGLTWAAAAVQWSQPRTSSRSQKTISRLGYGLAGVRSRAKRVLRRVEDRVFGPLDPTAYPPVREAPSKNGKNGTHPEPPAAPVAIPEPVSVPEASATDH